MVKITFLPTNTVIEVPAGSTLLQAAIAAGMQVESACGGHGTCGKCKVQIPREKVTPVASVASLTDKHLSDVERAEGWVLACKYVVNEDLTVKLSGQKDAHRRKTDLNRVQNMKINPSIEKYPVRVKQPSVSDQSSDWERLLAALPRHVNFNRRVAANLASTLRNSEFRVTAVVDGDFLLAVEKGDTKERSYGLAVDIGTTTVVVYLMNLNDGTVVANGAVTNPQRVFGADVISRITYASAGSQQLNQLQQKVVEGINGIVAQLCSETGVNAQEIYQAVVVGNTTMSHLFLGIDPTYLAPAPFIPVFRQTVAVQASELGLEISTNARVVVLPNVAGYVGADTVGVMLATGIDRLAGITLAIDIGTNGEMILAGQDRILTCSTAAGPAFEGAEITFGMRAADGAIENVKITDDVQLGVIGGVKPVGICGSGLIDAISEMARTGVINASGRMAGKPEQLEKLPPHLRQRLRRTEAGMEFVLAWGKDTATAEDIVLTQKDVRELQLAKGAIRAGVEILLAEMGITPEKIDRVLLAGAFGNYINKESALGIGLLPPVSLDRITAIGNAAGDGAKMALLSVYEREHAVRLAQKAEHIELSTSKQFQDQFVKALAF